MKRNAVTQDATFGYLSTWDSPEHGCLGGYLIVSHLGRPIEFHCTAPVRPSRAQQILYGPTLWPYLFGEQFGGRLVSEAKLRPSVLLVDHAAVLCLRSRIGIPMVRPCSRVERDISGEAGTNPEKEFESSSSRFVVAKTVLEFADGFESDSDAIADVLSLLAETIDVIEPFARIREAIREAHRLGEGAEVHHERAA